MKKQEMTGTEARIMIYLSQVKSPLRYGLAIANKLKIEYGYCLRVISQMHSKEWLRFEEYGTRKYWFVKKISLLEQAREIANGKQLQLKKG
jgi:DNA-binding MarR family transcriptional regulator